MPTESQTIGNCTLYCGDCFEILPQFNGIDAIITDPPYGTTQCKWDVSIDWVQFWPIVGNVRKDNAVTVMFSSQPFTTHLINSNPKEFRYEIIWYKSTATGFLDANHKPLKSHENICIFIKSGQVRAATYNPQMILSEKYYKKGPNKHTDLYGKFKMIPSTSDKRYPTSVVTHLVYTERCISTKTHRDTLHPTQKPVGLKQWLVNTYSNEGETVLDPFMGSGTTGVACVKTGRRFVGIELQRKYFDIACRRIEQAVRDNDGMFPEVRATVEQKELFETK